MKCFFTLAISITEVKRHSDTVILQKQIKQQIVVCTMQIICYATDKNRSQIKMKVIKQMHITL